MWGKPLLVKDGHVTDPGAAAATNAVVAKAWDSAATSARRTEPRGALALGHDCSRSAAGAASGDDGDDLGLSGFSDGNRELEDSSVGRALLFVYDSCHCVLTSSVDLFNARATTNGAGRSLLESDGALKPGFSEVLGKTI